MGIDYIRRETVSTISEVAREAGVSVATVSRVMNGTGTVSAETEAKVRSAIGKLDYQPNVWGRSLRRGESRMILIFVPNVTNPYYADIIGGIEDTARAAFYNTMLCITGGDRAKRMEYLSLLHSHRADGAIFLDTAMDSKAVPAEARAFPVVQCCEYCTDEAVSHVSIDNFGAAEDVMRYLLSLGHRAIGFVGSSNRFISTRQRREGYEMSLTQAGIGVRMDYESFADDDYSFLSGIRAAGELLDRKERPTALFCISDVLALGAVRAAEERGLKVPEDLTVVGFDDVEYAAMFRPMLTTVSQPCYELGRCSCELLLRQIGGGEAGTARFLPHKMILRDSAAQCAVESYVPAHN